MRRYNLDEVIDAIPDPMTRSDLQPALTSQLPARGGFRRPHQLGRIVEVSLCRAGLGLPQVVSCVCMYA